MITRLKIIFSITGGGGGGRRFEFRVVIFCPIPKNDNSEFSFYTWNDAWKRKFRVIIFCTTLKMITQISTKAFNIENIFQACLVSSQTHRVNNDFSNSAKD